LKWKLAAGRELRDTVKAERKEEAETARGIRESMISENREAELINRFSVRTAE